jgi:hypothetical protein
MRSERCYGTYIWLSVSKLLLECAVVSLYSVVKKWLKCNTGKVCNCLIQFKSGSGLYRHSRTSLPTPSVSAATFQMHCSISHACVGCLAANTIWLEWNLFGKYIYTHTHTHTHTVCSKSYCALRLQYVHLVVSIEVAVEVCCCLTVFSC